MTRRGTILVKNHVLEVPLCHAKMRLKRATQKVNYLMAKTVQKSIQKIIMRSCWTVFQVLLMSAVICI